MAKQIDAKGFKEAQVKTKNEKLLSDFTDQTGLAVQAVVSEAGLSDLIHNYDLYRLENIKVTGENTGSVPCDSTFSTMLQKRHSNTLRNRITNHKSFANWPITVGIVGVILLFIAYRMYPAVDIENQKEKQLEVASVELEKALKGKEYNTYPEGPLHINISSLIEGTEKNTYYNKVMYYADSMAKMGAAEKEQQQKLCDSTNAIYAQRIKKTSDSLLLEAKKTAATIKQNAESMKRSPAKAQGYKDEIAKANAIFPAAAKLRDSLVACDSESIRITNAQYASKIKWVDSAYGKVVKTILADTPSVESRVLTYDLSQKNNYYSGWPWFKWLFLTVIGTIGVVILVIMLVIIFLSLPEESEELALKNTPENLRVMAFPAKSNKSANDGRCNVKFNMSDAMREKINSVLIRYKTLNMLVPHNGFDFSDPALKVHERLTDIDITHAQSPLVYALVGNMAIFYAGVDTLKDEGEKAESLLVVEKPDKAPVSNQVQPGSTQPKEEDREL